MTETTNYQPIQLSQIQAIDKLIFQVISIFLTAFLVARAILVPMGHDEVATFYYFVQSGKVSPFLSNIDTNNHFLNSALTWVSYQFLGSSPLALRLPNLLFIPIFFFFLYKLTEQLKSRAFRLVFFITLAFTLHFTEFLALSRGYGMSMALLLGSLFYLFEGLRSLKLKPLIFSLGFIFLANIANLALINTYALILFIIAIIFIYNNLKSVKYRVSFFLLAGIIPFSLVVTQILYIKFHAGLIAGSPDNFWTTTITTLFAFLFETSDLAANIIAIILFLIIGAIGVIAILKLKKFNLLRDGKPFVFLYLFAGNILAILFLGFFFDVNYPDDRIGLYLYPLAIGSLVFLLDRLVTNPKWMIAIAIPFAILPVHFLIYLNTTYSIWYKYDVIPGRFYTEVMQNHKSGDIPPTIAGHGMRIFCWSYLAYRHGGEASQFYFTHFPDYNADFQIVNIKMIPGWQNYYDSLDYDAPSERYLLKHQKPHQYYTLINKRLKSIPKNNSEFTPLLDGSADTLRYKTLRVDINLSLLTYGKPFNSRLVFDVWNKKHESLRYEYIQFNWLRNVWNAPNNFNNCMLVYQVPSEASEYKIYIWNIDKAEFEIPEGYVRINQIK